MLIPWENMIKNRSTIITDLRPFCQDLNVGGQMCFPKCKLLTPHDHFLYHWFLNSASIYQPSWAVEWLVQNLLTHQAMKHLPFTSEQTDIQDNLVQ